MPNAMTYKEDRPIDQVIADLIEYHEREFPQIAQSLNPPASDTQLEELERTIGAELPEDFKVLYKTANGQNPVNEPLFHNGYEFMPIDDIIQTWEMMKHLYDDEATFRYERPVPQGPVRDMWWHPRWIPFGYMISGDHYCIDLIPAESGESGQVIEFIHDDTSRRHLGSSLKDFLGEYEVGLRSGKYFMHPEWQVIVSDDGM